MQVSFTAHRTMETSGREVRSESDAATLLLTSTVVLNSGTDAPLTSTSSAVTTVGILVQF